jgi:hypothetical protein
MVSVLLVQTVLVPMVHYVHHKVIALVAYVVELELHVFYPFSY